MLQNWNERLLLIFQALIFFGCCSAAIAAQTHSTGFRAGAAKIDITPDYPVRLSGFGSRRTESEGISQAIHARALVLVADNAAPVVLVTIDNCGVSAKLRNDVLAKLAPRGIQPERLTLLATHTHTAPMLDGVLSTLFGARIPEDQQHRIARYTAELTDRIAQVVVAALDDLRPARLSLVAGSVEFSKNRRTVGGPVDHALPVLLVHNKQGQLMAVHTSYACHCVTLTNNSISGDWAGYAAELIEREFPGCIGLISIGCGADQNPNFDVTKDRNELAKLQGSAIASEVKNLVTSPQKSISAALTCQLESISLPLATARSEDQWQARLSQGGSIGYHAQVQLDRLRAGQKLPEQIDYPIQTWKFGNELAFVFLPGEVVVDYALRLKQEFDVDRIWVCAYANDTPCYIPSERILREGGYEGEGAMVYYDLPQQLASGLEEKIIGAIQRQWAPEFLPKKLAELVPKN